MGKKKEKEKKRLGDIETEDREERSRYLRLNDPKPSWIVPLFVSIFCCSSGSPQWMS
jgi:hypothetical protein